MIKNTILLLALICLPFTAFAKKSVDPSYPNLAGQHASYLQKALADYRAGRRENVIMAGFAGPLTDQDIKDLAAWYSSQEGLKDLSIK
jgi:cytochrome c553